LPHPSDARIRLSLTLPQAAKIGLADQWHAVLYRRERRARRETEALVELQAIVARLLAHAEKQDWSLRQLAAKLAIPERSLRRARDRQLNPRRWLPILRAAEARLTPR
jgi:AraC-like DNA-binding protein